MTVPLATYRLQVHREFTFADAASTVPYLAELGVSHVYLSPSLASMPGSVHGYDVVDPSRLDEDRGGEEGFAQLAAACRQLGLGIVLDIVPNHVGTVPPHNPWWWDVLRHGPHSSYAEHFDIDWRVGPELQRQIVVPELGRSLLEELDDEAIRLVHHDDELVIGYHEHLWPLAPGSLEAVGLDPDDPDGAIAIVAKEPGVLLSLLNRQHYQLVHWRRGNVELNYRRFFDITTLAGVRVEDPAVFDEMHRRVLDLVEEGTVDGLRIDHPDGLHDPAGYFRRLRKAAPRAWIVVEKILEPGERRRRTWPVDGTVGYEFANLLLGMFVDPGAEGALTDVYARLLGERTDLEQLTVASKREVLDDLFPAELERLTETFACVADAAGLEVERSRLAAVLHETVAAFPVYRTYVQPEAGEVADEDRRYVEEAVARARATLDDGDAALDLLRDVLTLERRGPETAVLVSRFQQLTGPVMAKGVEDTTLYRYLRFVAVNEVGGHPGHLGRSLAELHEANALRQRDWPSTMLTTSTHDTKRSEDVRARLAVLSELPDTWVRTVEAWRERTASRRGERGPSAAHEYLVYQTLVGAWPIDEERLTTYLVKAAREGKQLTSWLDPDEEYEGDLIRFAAGLLQDHGFRAGLDELVARIAEPGWLTSLSQTLLRMTAPGVPDTYQGCELWDLSLVDPDNRRPVDLALRRALLDELAEEPPASELLRRLEDGVPKLWVIRQALRLRRQRPDAFGAEASYQPLYAAGAREEHVIAYVRGDAVLTIAPRLVLGLGGRFRDWSWNGTTIALPEGRWGNVLTGEVIDGGERRLSVLLGDFPVALLEREPPA